MPVMYHPKTWHPPNVPLAASPESSLAISGLPDEGIAGQSGLPYPSAVVPSRPEFAQRLNARVASRAPSDERLSACPVQNTRATLFPFLQVVSF